MVVLRLAIDRVLRVGLVWRRLTVMVVGVVMVLALVVAVIAVRLRHVTIHAARLVASHRMHVAIIVIRIEGR